jgi:hypothetical protein
MNLYKVRHFPLSLHPWRLYRAHEAETVFNYTLHDSGGKQPLVRGLKGHVLGR